MDDLQTAIEALENASAKAGSVIGEIAVERVRQMRKEGWSTAHDDEHYRGEMARAAACYAITSTMISHDTKAHEKALRNGLPGGMESIISRIWRWDADSFKPKNQRRDLIRAAALIVAEIERIDRASKGDGE